MISGEMTVNKTTRILITLTLSLTLLPIAANSDQIEQGAISEQRSEMSREERRSAWESLSKEEKHAKREQMRAQREQRRAEWEALTPEEREAKRAKMHEKWEAMTPEQREATKKRRKKRGQHGSKRGHHGGKKDLGE